MDQSQESDKIIQFYLNQQIRKVEEDKQQEQQMIEFERNKVKLQVWELLFKNIPQESQVQSKIYTSSSDQQDKYQILDQIIAKYEEKQSKIFEKSTKSNYFQKQIPTLTPEDDYEEQFEEYEPIEEDIQIEETIQDPQKLSVLLRSQKENSYYHNQESIKINESQQQVKNKRINLKQSKLDSFLKEKVPSIIENYSQMQINNLLNNNNLNINQLQDTSLLSNKDEQSNYTQNNQQSYLKLSKQQKFPTMDSQQQEQQVEEQFSDLQDIQDDDVQSPEDENRNKFYQFSIKFDDEENKDKLKKFDQLKRKKILEMEELKNLRQIRNNLNKESVVKRDPSPKMMPSASFKRIPREEIVKQEVKQEVKTPQMRTTTRKSPMPRAKETAHFNNLPFQFQDTNINNADRSISCDKQKNNKKMLKNAITYACLAGEPNRKEREFMLQKLESSEADHFILLFKAIGRTDVKGVYSMIGNTAQLLFSSGRCPSLLTPDMIRGYYKYDSGGKQFKEIEGNRGFTIMVDAVQLRK